MPSKSDGRMHRKTGRTYFVNPEVDEIAEDHQDWHRAMRGEKFIVTMITETYEVWYTVKNGVREQTGENYSVILGGAVINRDSAVPSTEWSEQKYTDGLSGRDISRLPDVVKDDYIVGKNIMAQ